MEDGPAPVFLGPLWEEKSIPGIEKESSMESRLPCPIKVYFLKARNDFVPGSSLLPSRESTPRRN
jgi:hypothetical protein